MLQRLQSESVQINTSKYISLHQLSRLWCISIYLKLELKGGFDTTNRQVHDRALFWLGTYTSIKRGGVKLVLWK
jgi:hypothetical protein